jgi:hypothetical protein
MRGSFSRTIPVCNHPSDYSSCRCLIADQVPNAISPGRVTVSGSVIAVKVAEEPEGNVGVRTALAAGLEPRFRLAVSVLAKCGV